MLVSEAMLQQTQVARVVPRYLRFLDRFPDPAALAAAPVSAAIAEWTGLGYNRRAVQLHRAATEIAVRHAGRVPDDMTALLALPGVGGYTARAVLAFAFERPVGVIDVNAARVLARAVAGRPLGRREAQQLADAAVPPTEAWAYNQAVLDLGAGVCTAHRPRCRACPLAEICAWQRRGGGHPDPAIGSAGVPARQSTFAGSDRQGRGRLVAALVRGPIAAGEVAAAAGWPDDESRARRVVDSLVAHGLAVADEGGALSLPAVSGPGCA